MQWWLGCQAEDRFGWPWEYYYLIYLLYSPVPLLMGFFGRVVVFLRGLVGARVLHARLIKHVIRATQRFYDTTPQGRILSRFSRDTNMIDMALPFQFEGLIGCSTPVVMGMVTVTAVVGPLFLLFFIPVFYVYLRCLAKFRPAARDTNRLSSLNHSPLFQHFTAMLAGLPTIRAFGMEQTYRDDNRMLLDHAQQPRFASESIRLWMSFNLGILTCSVQWCAAGSIMLLHDLRDEDEQQDIILISMALMQTLMFAMGMVSHILLAFGLHSSQDGDIRCW